MGAVFIMFPTIWSSLDKNKNPPENDLQKIQPFIFCKWLAGNPQTIFDSNVFNQYKIPIENQYYYIKNKYAGKIRNIKYIKNEKDIKDMDIDFLQNYFKINREKALEYIDFISEKELNYIRGLYKERDK